MGLGYSLVFLLDPVTRVLVSDKPISNLGVSFDRNLSIVKVQSEALAESSIFIGRVFGQQSG